MVLLTWLRLIHTDLPKLVKQRYGTELRSRTLASIKPEISQALESLLEELQSSEDVKVMHANTSNFQLSKSRSSYDERQRPVKCCPLYKEDRHYQSTCAFLPKSDKKYMVKARQIVSILDDSDDEVPDIDPIPVESAANSVNRVQVRQSPYLDVFFDHHSARQRSHWQYDTSIHS